MAWWNLNDETSLDSEMPKAAPVASAEPNPGTLTTAFSNPWVSIPSAVGLGLLSGATRGTGRIAQGLNAGLELGIAGEKSAYERDKQKRLSETLDKLSTATTPTAVEKVGINPETATFSIPNAPKRLNEAMEPHSNQPSVWNGAAPLAPAQPTPTYQTIENKPIYTPRQQEYLKVIGKSNPQAALTAMGSTLFKEPVTPHTFGSPESGYYSLNQNNVVTPLVPGTAKDKTHVVTTTDDQGNKVQRLMTEPEMRAAGNIPSAVTEPKEKSVATNDLATFVGTGGKIRPPSIPAEMTLDQGKSALKEARAMQQQTINISQAGLGMRERKMERIPDQDRRTIGNIDAANQQLDEIEKTFKLTPAYKTGKVSDALRAAFATNTKARVLDQMGILPTEGLTNEEKNFAAAYNAMLLKLRTVSGDNRFSDQDATRAMQAIGTGMLGRDLPRQLQATKAFLGRERGNLVQGLDEQGYNVEKLNQRSPSGTPAPKSSGQPSSTASTPEQRLQEKYNLK